MIAPSAYFLPTLQQILIRSVAFRSRCWRNVGTGNVAFGNMFDLHDTVVPVRRFVRRDPCISPRLPTAITELPLKCSCPATPPLPRSTHTTDSGCSNFCHSVVRRQCRMSLSTRTTDFYTQAYSGYTLVGKPPLFIVSAKIAGRSSFPWDRHGPSLSESRMFSSKHLRRVVIS